MRRLGWTLSLLSLCATLLLFAWLAQDRSPGELAAVHGRIPELRGEPGCGRCHGEGPGATDHACLGCHTSIASARQEDRGLHAGSRPAGSKPCGACHGEHHGVGFEPVNDQSFAQAGVAARALFDHGADAGIRFQLAGRHRDLPCVSCHADAAAEPLPAGRTRFLGLRQECTTCHRDVHEGRLGPDCVRCHGQERPFAQAPLFAHDPRFPLTGKHAGLACAGCHPQGPVAAVSAPVRECAACHANPHAPAADGTAAKRLPLARAHDCARCHHQERFAGLRFGAEEHARLGVVLDGAHATAACARCHGPGHGFAVPRNEIMASCGGCHADPHGASGPAAVRFATGGACRPCHGTTSFRSALARSAGHGSFGGFLLAGPHAEVACSGCHSGRRTARLTSLDSCQGCHASPHRTGGLAASPCVPCHTAADLRFTPPLARMDAALHALTGFVLAPPHAGLDCAVCHGQPGAVWAQRFPGRTKDQCMPCHGDPHGRQFTAGRFDSRRCTDCHQPLRFSPATFAMSSHARTRFPLSGAHTAVGCDACHTTTGARPPATAAGRAAARRFAGTPMECEACHRDPHGGQFREQGTTDCTRCHTTAGFTIQRFDHQKGTRFPLDQDHARLPCAACHRPMGTGAQAVVRFRPLGVRCQDCHDARGKDLRRRG